MPALPPLALAGASLPQLAADSWDAILIQRGPRHSRWGLRWLYGRTEPVAFQERITGAGAFQAAPRTARLYHPGGAAPPSHRLATVR